MAQDHGMMLRQQVLADFGEFALRSEDLDAVLTEACRLVAQALGVDRAKILEIQAASAELLVRAGVGWRADVVGKLRMPLSERSSETFSIEAGEPVITRDIAKEDRFDVPDFLKDAGVVAFVNVPIFVPGARPYGILQVDSTEPRAFDQDDIQFLRTYAAILGPVIDRLHLAQVRRRVEEQRSDDIAALEALQRVSAELVGEHQAQHHYQRIVEAAAALMRADAASIQALDGGNGQLNLLASQGLHPDAFWQGVGADSASPCGQAVARGHRIVVPDITLFDGEPGEREAYRRSGLLAMQSTPLRAFSGQIVGMLSTYWRECRTPAEQDYRFFDVLARLSADLIERVQANERLRASEERLRQFGEASSDVVWIRSAKTFAWEYLSPAFEVIYGMPVKTALSGDTFRNWADLIVEEDRERALANIVRVRDGERVSFEYRICRPDGERRWMRDNDFPMLGPSGEVERIGGVGQDITDRKLVEIALRDRERRLKSIIETARDYAILTLDATGRVSGWWGGAEAVFGYAASEIVGVDSAILWLEGDRARGEPEKERAIAWEEGRAPDVRWHLRKDGSQVFVDGMTTPLVGSDGEVTGYLKVGRDLTERHAADRRQEVLVAELQHRTRNLIAVVRSIAAQTMATTGPTEAFPQHFNDRLDALARVQGLLSRSEDEPVTIESLVRQELEALGGGSGRVVLQGPVVGLRNSLVQTLALALHELATNARKHGALSQDNGVLSVIWEVVEGADGQHLSLEWLESGAQTPIDTTPQRRGYGRELIERALPYALGATTTYALRPQGARCTIDLPLEKRRSRRRHP